jgi:hypothetical protein
MIFHAVIGWFGLCFTMFRVGCNDSEMWWYLLIIDIFSQSSPHVQSDKSLLIFKRATWFATEIHHKN